VSPKAILGELEPDDWGNLWGAQVAEDTCLFQSMLFSPEDGQGHGVWMPARNQDGHGAQIGLKNMMGRERYVAKMFSC
jgi:hypothetical protein